MTFTNKPIGIIETPFNDLQGMPIQPSGADDVIGTIKINKELEAGLDDIKGFSHVILLYYFHKTKGYSLKVKPFLGDQERGLFSTRAPRRPNPLGISIVQLLQRNDNILTVKGIDVLNGTQLIDIKPYVPGFGEKSASSIGWLESKQERATSLKSDRRFIDTNSGM